MIYHAICPNYGTLMFIHMNYNQKSKPKRELHRRARVMTLAAGFKRIVHG